MRVCVRWFLVALCLLPGPGDCSALDGEMVIEPGHEQYFGRLVDSPDLARCGWHADSIRIGHDRVRFRLARPSSGSTAVIELSAPNTCAQPVVGATAGFCMALPQLPQPDPGVECGADMLRRALADGIRESSLPFAWSVVAAPASGPAVRTVISPEREPLVQRWLQPLLDGGFGGLAVTGFLICTAVLALVLVASRRARVWALAAAVAPAAYVLNAWWLRPSVAVVWIALVPLLLWAVGRMVRRRDTTLVWFAVPSLCAMVTRLVIPWRPANWYVDYAAVAGAVQEPMTRLKGGFAGWPNLLSHMVPVSPSIVFVLSALVSSLAIGLMVAALSRFSSAERGPWPSNTRLIWAVALCLDGTLVFVGVSDAPHNVALFAFAVGFFAFAEAVDGEHTGNRGARMGITLVAVFVSSVLVGLTRMELLLAPLAFPFVLFRRHPSWRGSLVSRHNAAAILGVVTAGLVMLRYQPLGQVAAYGPRSWTAVASGLAFQGPWAITSNYLLVCLAAPVLFVAFLVVVRRRPCLSAILVGYLLVVVPKLIGGFVNSPIGMLDPADRYNVLIIPIGLLILACGLAELIRRLPAFAPGGRPSRRLLLKVAGVALVLVAPVVVVRCVFFIPCAHQVEYRFLSRVLPTLPPRATVATVWLETLSTGLDLDNQLAVPHSLLTMARPDIRWVVIEPGEPLPEGEAVFYYHGATCSLDPLATVRGGEKVAADQLLVRQHLRLCADLEARSAADRVRMRQRVRPGTWPLEQGEVSLFLAPLAGPREASPH